MPCALSRNASCRWRRNDLPSRPRSTLTSMAGWNWSPATSPSRLGMDRVTDDITEVFHLVACVRLGRSSELAYRVNVEGTRRPRPVLVTARPEAPAVRQHVLRVAATTACSSRISSTPARHSRTTTSTPSSKPSNWCATRSPMDSRRPSTAQECGGRLGHRRDAEIRRSVLCSSSPHEAAQIRSRPRVADPDQVRFGLVPATS